MLHLWAGPRVPGGTTKPLVRARPRAARVRVVRGVVLGAELAGAPRPHRPRAAAASVHLRPLRLHLQTQLQQKLAPADRAQT